MDRGKAAARNYRDPWKGKGTGVIKLNDSSGFLMGDNLR
jgi:hypothetical protein